MDGPRLKMQILKFILLDALGPGNWIGAQSEENNRVRMVALYKVEAEGSFGMQRCRWRCPSIFLSPHHDLRPPTPRRAYFREAIRRVHIAPPAALSVVSIVVAPVALLKYGVLSARLNIRGRRRLLFDEFLAF
jgi:hypothetical protein